MYIEIFSLVIQLMWKGHQDPASITKQHAEVLYSKMSNPDRNVKIILSLSLFIYLAVGITSYFIQQLSFLTTFVNLMAGTAVLCYWITRQLKIQHHIIETREIIFLSFELMVIIVSVYHLVSGIKYKWVEVMQYFVFVIHLLLILASLVYMLMFKMKKLW